MEKWGFVVKTGEDLDTGIFYLLTYHMFKWGNADVKKVLKSFDNMINKSTFSREFSRAIREKKIFYIYDVGMLSEIISYQLQRLYQACIASGERTRYDESFRIDRKSILRLFTKAFPYNSIGYIINKLEEQLEKRREYLDEMKKTGFLKYYAIRVFWGDYNEQAKALSPKVIIHLDLGNTWIGLDAQINYYDVSEELFKDKNVIKLIETNLRIIGYEASKKFIEYLYEYNITK